MPFKRKIRYLQVGIDFFMPEPVKSLYQEIFHGIYSCKFHKPSNVHRLGSKGMGTSITSMLHIVFKVSTKTMGLGCKASPKVSQTCADWFANGRH